MHCMHVGGTWLLQLGRRLPFSGSDTASVRGSSAFGSSAAGGSQTGGKQHRHRQRRERPLVPAAAAAGLHPAAGDLPLRTACSPSISCRAASSSNQAAHNFSANRSSLSASQGQQHPACGCGRRRPAALGRGQGFIPRAGLDATVQDVLMGGTLAIAIGMALYYGSKGEPEVCEGCGGAGGVRCFACEGTGVMAASDAELDMSPEAQRRAKKGAAGGALRPRAPRRGECRACRGSGLLVCKRCNGSGYSRRM